VLYYKPYTTTTKKQNKPLVMEKETRHGEKINITKKKDRIKTHN